jgi:hypothetical protein
MKKRILFGCLLTTIVITNSFAQSQGQGVPPTSWKSQGNTALTTDYFGTNNNTDLILKTNALERVRFDKNGDVIVGGGNGGGGSVHINPGQVTNPIAGFMLTVGGGDVYFDRSLFVHDFVESWQGFKGPKMETDNLTVSKNLMVIGDAIFKGNLTAEVGVMFDSSIGIKYFPKSGSTPTKIIYGGGNPLPFSTGCMVTPADPTLHLLSGFVQVYDGNDIANTQVLQLAGNKWGCNIEANDVNGTDAKPLSLNYYCGGDVNICTNIGGGGGSNGHGGVVTMGWNLNVGYPWPNDNNKAVNIKANSSIGLNIMDGSNVDIFTISNTGKTLIGPSKLFSGSHTDAMLQVGGKIACKELYVIKPANWSDFVFDPNYKLKSLFEVETFYKKNKHLEGVPSESDVMSNGIEMAQMNSILLQKIEELTIYVVELEKKVNEKDDFKTVMKALALEITFLKDKVKELESKK